jgi:hypothetical protein
MNVYYDLDNLCNEYLDGIQGIGGIIAGYCHESLCDVLPGKQIITPVGATMTRGMVDTIETGHDWYYWILWWNRRPSPLEEDDYYYEWETADYVENDAMLVDWF